MREKMAAIEPTAVAGTADYGGRDAALRREMGVIETAGGNSADFAGEGAALRRKIAAIKTTEDAVLGQQPRKRCGVW